MSRGKDFRNLREDYDYDFFFDLNSAQECSRKTNRKLLLVFTGYTTVSCPGTHYELFKNKKIKRLIQNDYIPTILYIDVNINGINYANLLSDSFDSNTIPTYAIVDSNLKPYGNKLGYTRLKDSKILVDELKRNID